MSDEQQNQQHEEEPKEIPPAEREDYETPGLLKRGLLNIDWGGPSRYKELDQEFVDPPPYDVEAEEKAMEQREIKQLLDNLGIDITKIKDQQVVLLGPRGSVRVTLNEKGEYSTAEVSEEESQKMVDEFVKQQEESPSLEESKKILSDSGKDPEKIAKEGLQKIEKLKREIGKKKRSKKKPKPDSE